MKKLIALLLALLSILSLASCSDEVPVSTPTEISEEPEAAVTEVTATSNPEKPSYTVFEALNVPVLDVDGLTVTIGDFQDDYGSDISCQVEIKNSSCQTAHISFHTVAVNGKITDDTFAESVGANTTIAKKFELESMDVPKNLTRLSILLYVSDEVYNTATYLLDIYPQGQAAYTANPPAREGFGVLVDDGNIFAVSKKINYSSKPSLSFLAFNDSQQILTLTLNPTAINNFGIHNYYSVDMLPNTYIEDRISLSEYQNLLDLGMENSRITSVSLHARVDIGSKQHYNKQVTVYPEGEALAESFTYIPEPDDVIVLESTDLRLLQVRCQTPRNINKSNITFILENKTGKPLHIKGNNIKLNGQSLAQTFFSCSSNDGRDCCAVLSFADDLDELGITAISELEMTVEVLDEHYEPIHNETVLFQIA